MSRRVFLLSPSGWGNLGDDAILHAVTDWLHDSYPDANVIAATLSPADTCRSLGVPSVALRGASIPGYHVKSHAICRARAGSAHEPQVVIMDSAPQAEDRNIIRRLLPVSIRKPLFMPLRVLRRVKAEIGHSLRIWRWLRRARAVIVCGGGQLDEFWGGPWGHPLTLAIWAALARRRGVPFIVVSVGAGQVKAAAARWLLARALDGAKHVSVRDPRSARMTRTLMQEPFTESRDIAFLLGRKMSLDAPQTPADRIRVAFSPMAFARAGIWPRADENTYTAYFNAMRDCCAEWLSRGWSLTLYSTATMDRATLLDLQAALQRNMPAHAGSVRVLPQGTVSDLISALRQHHICVAARLHGVILSQLAVVPTVAIVHDWKVEEQMTMAGHGDFALDIHGVTAEGILRAGDALLARSSQVASGLSGFARNSLQTVLDDLRTLQPLLTRPGARNA